MKNEELITELEELSALQARIKERGMIYQAQAKDDLASAFSRPPGYFYYWPYDKWARVERRLSHRRQAQ